jgi:hypothetical protein
MEAEFRLELNFLQLLAVLVSAAFGHCVTNRKANPLRCVDRFGRTQHWAGVNLGVTNQKP